jgi:hypothetical protein
MSGDKRASVLRPMSNIIISHEDGGVEEIDCVHCCHCGVVMRITPGSGKKRGYCMKCMRVTCGQGKCDACVPYEKQVYEPEKILRTDWL